VLQDLDDEKFTVSNGAHFALERMPHIQWIPALDKSSLGSQIIMPGAVQDEAIVDLIAAVESHVQTNALMHHVGDLTVEEVSSSLHFLERTFTYLCNLLVSHLYSKACHAKRRWGFPLENSAWCNPAPPLVLLLVQG